MKCERCSGGGEVQSNTLPANDRFPGMWSSCPDCKGSGQIRGNEIATTPPPPSERDPFDFPDDAELVFTAADLAQMGPGAGHRIMVECEARGLTLYQDREINGYRITRDKRAGMADPTRYKHRPPEAPRRIGH
jgi:hypothetical protein